MTPDPAPDPAVAVPAAAPPPDLGAALSVSHLDVTYQVRGEDRLALRDVSFQIGRGESYGLVGESGSGKSTVALALVRYLPSNGRVSAGTVSINGLDPLSMNASALRDLRARTVSMVYQEPGRALNPSLRAGRQIAEVFRIAGQSSDEATASAEEMLRKVQIADPGLVMRRYPYELSGGMAQRVVIAMALAVSPSLLILDEPTTALDATVEAEVLDLVAALRQEFDTSVLFISHNLAVIARMCDRVGVLYAGELVEEGPARRVFEEPRHPYTVGLLRCLPRLGQRKDTDRLDTIPGFLPTPGHTMTGCIFAPRCALAADRCRESEPPLFSVDEVRTSRCFFHEQAPDLPRATPASVGVLDGNGTGDPLVVIEGLSKTFAGGVRALAGVDLSIRTGETLGLVGESGSGKTTLARVLLGLTAPDQGSVVTLHGKPLSPDARRRPRETLRALQIVFQNPDSALNRRHTVRALISRPLARLAGLSGRAAARTAVRPDLLGTAGGPAPGAAPEPAVRRAQAARRDRARVRQRPGDRGLRRADVGARRLGPGGHPQPAGRPAESGAGHLPVHLARPGPGPVPVGPDRGALPRPGDGSGAVRDGLRRTASPVHRGVVLGRALARRPASRADPADGRDTVRGRPADRLRVPHQVPAAADHGHLRIHRAPAARGRTGSPDPLPHPAR